LKEKYKEGGFKAVSSFGTQGVVARIAHVALTTMLMKTMSAELYLAYNKAVYGDDA